MRILLQITQVRLSCRAVELYFHVKLKFQLSPKEIKRELFPPKERDAAHSSHTSNCTLLADSRYYAYKRVLSQNPALAELNRRKFTILTSE